MTIAEKRSDYTSLLKELDLLALLPCPVKVPFEQAFREFLLESGEALSPYSFCLEGHVNHHLSFYDRLEQAAAGLDLPRMLITPGVNRFMGHAFQNKFLHGGSFARQTDFFRHPAPGQNELIDPQGHYFLLAINPLVMVMDHTRMGDRPIPKYWADLLTPCYQDQIVMRGQKETFCETVLLSFYREFEEEGITRLARNVKLGCHPAQMAKHAGTNKPGWPAISLMPYFFAKTICNQDKVSIIWPEDGAIASPITLLVQQAALPALRPVIDFLTGPVMAGLWARAFFFAPFSEHRPDVPGNGRIKWLGWDFIYSVDAYTLFAQLNNLFRQVMQAKSNEVLP